MIGLSISQNLNQLVIPQELLLNRQWVVWRYEERRGNKPAKVPYNPTSGKKASVVNPHTWASYDEVRAAREAWNGIGYVLSDEDPFVGIDLDNCRDDQTGEIEQWAQEIIDRFGSYTEISPSGRGIHIIIKGSIPGDGRKKGNVEAYDREHFFTVTGNGTGTIQVRSAELRGWYQETFHQRSAAPHPQSVLHSTAPFKISSLLERAKRAKNGKAFSSLWEGDASGYSSQSEADLALCNMLAFWTDGNSEQIDQLFRQSGLMRPKWDEARGKKTYGELTIEAAINQVDAHYHPREKPDERITYIYPWQRREETQEERETLLSRHGQQIKGRVGAHIEAHEKATLVIAVAPGVGKTYHAAQLGIEAYDIAWIVERHDMAGSVEALEKYRHIEDANERTCPRYYRQHREVAVRGWNAHALHRKHNCDYINQYRAEGSAIYQVEHVPTAYPKKHDAAIVDELNISRWLSKRAINRDQIGEARRVALNSNQHADQLIARLLDALDKTISQAQQQGQPINGKTLFDMIDGHCANNLEGTVTELGKHEHVMNLRPVYPDYPETVEGACQLPQVIVPHLLRALITELPKWKEGADWNSCIRIARDEGMWALIITEPLRFSLSEGEHLPTIILDATADEALYSLLLGTQVFIERIEIDPPPHTRHIAVRTGKRYGKFSLTKSKYGEDKLERVVKELRYLLSGLDPDGEACKTGMVGLITYKDCADIIGDALEIPEDRRGHFWGVRGSNAFKDCRILLVIGTPQPNPETVQNMARVLYRDDPKPIDATWLNEDDRMGHYHDQRVQMVSNYLIRSELTQCAHRNRPLRYDGRVVITLSAGEVDFLPVTEEITSLPNLEHDGTPSAQKRKELEQTRLESAEQELRQRGEKVTRRSMEAELRKAGKGIKSEKITAYLTNRRANLETQ